jgi:hypothetical protein
MMGSPFSENVRRMQRAQSDGGAGADYAEECLERDAARRHQSMSAGGSWMKFSREPTARGDQIAGYVREWYEANREGWWDRRRKTWRYAADEFILHLIGEVHRVESEAARQMREHEGQ